MKNIHSYLIWVCIIGAGVISAAAQQKKADSSAKPFTPTLSVRPEATVLPSEETVNAFMQQMFGYDPSLSWKVADVRPSEVKGLAEVMVVLSSTRGQQPMKFYVAADGEHALAGQIMPFGANPFAAARKQLEKGTHGPAHGPATAPVTVVEFSDFQCPHCKEVQPQLERLMTESSNIRLVFENFPLAGHDWAAKAAAYADCVGASSNEAFWKFIQNTYVAQGDITASNADEKLTALADGAGVKGSDIAACAAKPDAEAHVQQSVALGKSVKVEGTPTLFINGRKIDNLGGIPYEVLKMLVDFAAKQPAVQATN